jgi:hypothetical protein
MRIVQRFLYILTDKKVRKTCLLFVYLRHIKVGWLASLFQGSFFSQKRNTMAYTETNFKTKKAVKEAIAAGKKLRVFQPGPFANSVPTNGVVFLEGPHYPAAHTWYAKGTLKDGFLVKVV